MSKPNRHLPTLKDAVLAAVEWYQSPAYIEDPKPVVPRKLVTFFLRSPEDNDNTRQLETLGSAFFEPNERGHEGHVRQDEISDLSDLLSSMIELGLYHGGAVQAFERSECKDLEEQIDYDVFATSLGHVLKAGAIRLFFCRQCLDALRPPSEETR